MSFVTSERCEEVRSMKPSRPDRRVGRLSLGTAGFAEGAGGKEST